MSISPLYMGGKEIAMGNSFDEAMARDWLNSIISCMKQIASLEAFNNQIKNVCTSETIQLFTGIEILSDLLGLKLSEGGRNGKYYKYYFFL